jgi:PAS domain S-box-containing protein
MPIERNEAALARLRLSEERLQALVEASTQTIWTATGDGQLTWIAPSWTEATGQPLGEALGHGWLERIHPDDRDVIAVPLWRAAERTEQKIESTMRIRHRDGTYRWYHVRAVPLRGDDGSVREWIAANTDVDLEHRHRAALAERRARAELLSAANDLFLQSLEVEETLRSLAKMVVPLLADWCAIDMLEADGTLRRITVEHSDPEMVRFAYELAEKYPSDPNAPRGMYAVARSGQTDWMPEIPKELLEASATSPEHLEAIQKLSLHGWISTPIRTRSGVAGVLTLISSDAMRRFDETDVQLASDLATRAGHAIDNARLYQQAVEANRAKDEFLATLSHELRTPLTAILGWASLLNTTDFDRETLRQATRQIEQSARVQAALIDDLLDVSRVITGKLQIDIRTVDITPVIESAISAIQPAAAAKRIDVITNLPASLVVRADRNRLQQIVWNLLSNAIKFSNEETRVEISLIREDSQVVLRVRDEGIGIPSHLLPRVFDRFWQADASSHRLQGGLGLGLAIVKHLVELHGGSVAAESAGEGRGALFTVRLPA